MKIIITGSLGHIGKPLAEELLQKGNTVTVVSSNPEKKSAIEALGATAAIGSIEDINFLTQTFTGAGAVYCMIPPADHNEPDRRTFYSRIAHNYAQAITNSGVKRVIHLSSFGADLDHGTGIILGAYDAENIFNQLAGITLTHIRPTYFYYNLENFVNSIKHQNAMIANYGGDEKILLVAPADIAEVIAEEAQNLESSNHVRYIASDERTGNEIASIIGAEIGKLNLTWKVISNEQSQSNLQSFGMPSQLASGLVDMYDSMHKGDMARDFYLNQPAKWGKVKMEDYAKEFATLYNK